MDSGSGNVVTMRPKPVVEAANSAAETVRIPKALFDNVLSLTEEVVGWGDDFRVANVGYIIGTHIYEAFETYPITRFKGMPGTGKTRSLEVDAALCNDPVCFTSETDAVLFRMAARGNTLLIDEVTSLSRDAKKILKSGWQRNIKVLRNHSVSKTYTKQKDDAAVETTITDYQVKGHAVYCPKVLAGQGDFNDDALEQRTITYNMSHAPRRADGSKWRGPLSAEFHIKAAALKSEITKWSVSVRAVIGKDHMATFAPSGAIPDWMNGRESQAFNALYCLVPTEYHKSLEAVAKEHANYVEREMADSSDSAIVEALIKVVRVPKGMTSITFYPQTIAESVNETRPEDDEVTGKMVAARLKALGFENESVDGKVRRTKQGIPLVATRALLERLGQKAE